MVMRWQLAEAGPGARSIYIVLAPGCFAGYPTTRVVQAASAIKIRAFGWRPAIHHGHLDTTCGSGVQVQLGSSIDGRQVEERPGRLDWTSDR
jgi:hypothetical protein